MYNFNKIYVLADIHGDFEHLCNVIRNLAPGSLLIQLGDFGLGFKSEVRDLQILQRINNVLVEKEVNLFVLRGNHCKKEFWDKNLEYSNLKLIKDYTQLTINNNKCLFVGGAISVDRLGRKIGVDYWLDEGVIYLSKKELEKIGKIDYLFIHSAPDFCFPRGYDAPIVTGWAKYDKNLIRDLKEEREYLSLLVKTVKPKYMYRGHFHSTCDDIFMFDDFVCVDTLLDINEWKQIL